MATNLPPNVHVSQHPSVQAKMSQLRSKSASARETNALVHEISLIVACEALAESLAPVPGPKDQTPIGADYETADVSPSTMCIVPILRSGLAMVDAVQTVLPRLVPVHHLGMYREPSTLDPVEYYNNLSSAGSGAASLAILVDPIIATGGTCAAAIQTLREWGAKRVLVLSVLGAAAGVAQVAREWPEGTELWMAAVDEGLTPEGMVKPGLGDVGDRLFLTLGK
ncbi:uracil phosphoribosyltransferase [Beauveria bassiana ARSEF 2860]|uniref:uracil phosphoribosyltransferase n=1 Tax=Beauveria bassiana (strain ARSEF 2860) TaxID=655819 RepID=J4UG11_BEAB2|nr:uracil phosphoribosyltransferase [Beauveria bassiana ARSEF 2860]EJP61642.1 uracil phosphoribosyltransferase [Beauveria bassiana ARSEF 2860]